MNLINGVDVRSDPVYTGLPCRDSERRAVGQIRCGPDVAKRVRGHDKNKIVNGCIDFADQTYVNAAEGILCHEFRSGEDWDVVWIVCSSDASEQLNSEKVKVVLYSPELGMAWVEEQNPDLGELSNNTVWSYYNVDSWTKVSERDVGELEFYEIPDEVILAALKGTIYESKIMAQMI